jgi:hypothetical protein
MMITPSERPNEVPTNEGTFAELVEQINQALERGDRVGLQELLGNHPQYEQRARELLPAIEALVQLGRDDA